MMIAMLQTEGIRVAQTLVYAGGQRDSQFP